MMQCLKTQPQRVNRRVAFPLAVQKISRMSKLARLTALDLPYSVLVPCHNLLAHRAPDSNGLRAVRLFVRLQLREED